MEKPNIVDSGAIVAHAPKADISRLRSICTHDPDEVCDCEIEAEVPLQEISEKWQFRPRQNPKWGTVEREGLIVGRGANRKVIPPDEVWKLAALGCTIEEMADWFQVNRETLKYNFSDYILKGRAELKRRLRAAQIKTAMAGNATLLIWLGKNILGQTDNPQDSDANSPLPWNDNE